MYDNCCMSKCCLIYSYFSFFTNKTKKKKEQNELLMLMNHPFAKPLSAPGRMHTLQTKTIYFARPDFDIEISHCACSAMHGYYSSILALKERTWSKRCKI